MINLTELKEQINDLTDNQRTSLIKEAVGDFTQKDKQDVVLESVRSLSDSGKKEVVVTATKDLNTEDKKVFAEAVLGQPTQKATDTLWLIVVISFSFAFLASIGAIVYAAVNYKPIDEKLIILFTTISAFLAGLLAPSPVRN